MSHFDEMAVGVLLGARDVGLNAPGDVAVMGYDDGPMAVAADLTTISQPFEQSGAAAARALIAAMQTPTDARTVTFLQPFVVERSTTAAAPGARLHIGSPAAIGVTATAPAAALTN